MMHVNEHLQLHRIDGPAIVGPNGAERWYLNGQLHRTDGPAVVRGDYQAWYFNGMRHRIGGPAIVWDDGHQEWYKYDELHRTDGPAAIRADGTQLWSINGKLMTKFEHWLLVNAKEAV